MRGGRDCWRWSERVAVSLQYGAGPLVDSGELRAARFHLRALRVQHDVDARERGLQFSELRFVEIELRGGFGMAAAKLGEVNGDGRHLLEQCAEAANVADVKNGLAAQGALCVAQEFGEANVHFRDILKERIHSSFPAMDGIFGAFRRRRHVGIKG